MANIVFVTVYDEFAVGIRIMSSILREAGHDTKMIFLKVPINKPVPYEKPYPLEFIFLHSGKLHTWCPPGPPWSRAEEDLLVEEIGADAPDIIAYSSRSIFDRDSLPLLHRLKETFPSALLVAGGFGPVLNPKNYLREVDFVVFGEGEKPMLALADAHDRGIPYRAIDNLIFKDGGRLVRNPVSKPEENLDVYPSPDFRNPATFFIEDNTLHRKDPGNSPGLNNNFHPVLLGRGCIGKCNYCSTGQWNRLHKEFGHPMKSRRMRSIAHVIEELVQIKDKGFPGVQFLDSFLVAPKEYMLAFFKCYEKEVGLRFLADMHPVQIMDQPEVFDAACRAGLHSVTAPVQHGDQDMREILFSRKLLGNDWLVKLSKMYTDRNLDIHYHAIAGIPYETATTLDNSLRFMSRLPWKNGRLTTSRLMNFPYSPLTERIAKDGLPKIYDYDKWFLTGLLYHFSPEYGTPEFGEMQRRANELIFADCGRETLRKYNAALYEKAKAYDPRARNAQAAH